MKNTNLRVLTVSTNKTLLDQTAINNGAIYFVEDTKELFYDYNGSRLAIQDILILDKEEDRTSILFVPLNKFYFILETSTLWYYKSKWYKISNDPELATTVKAGIVQLATDNEVEEGTSETKVVTVKQLATYSNCQWGNITGTLSSQKDLQNALNAKADTTTVNAELDKKVDKVEGKSLIENTEIERLKTLKNYDDTQIKTDITNINSVLETKASTTDLENGLKTKQDKLTFDTTPTANSTKPVTSGGIKTALDKKIDTARESKYMPLLYTKQSVSNPTNMVAQPYIKLATVTFKNTFNYDLSQLFWLEFQRASTFKAHALVKLTARWGSTNYEAQVFEILEDYNGGNAEWENILKSLTWAYKFTAKTSTTGNILTGEIWIKIPNIQYCTYYLRPTECNCYSDYGQTTVTVTNNPWVYTNGNNQNVASITTGYTQVKVVDKSTYTDLQNRVKTVSGSLNMWTGTKAEYDKIIKKDSKTIYNITDDDNINALIDLSDYVRKEEIKENWNVGVRNLIQNTNLPITGDDNLPGITFDLSTIIPKDSKNYEIIISGIVNTTNVSQCRVDIDTGDMKCSLLTAPTTGIGAGTCTCIINNDRKIKIYNYGDKAVTLQQLTLCAYKPIK